MIDCIFYNKKQKECKRYWNNQFCPCSDRYQSKISVGDKVIILSHRFSDNKSLDTFKMSGQILHVVDFSSFGIYVPKISDSVHVNVTDVSIKLNRNGANTC